MTIQAAFEPTDWAMTQEHFDSMVALASPDNEPVALRTEVTDDDTYVIYVSGPIVSDHDLFSIMFGATSSADIVAAIAEGQSHARIKKVYDSGGGQVKGGEKVVAAIRASAVPISSHVDGICASQAFLYASSVLDSGKPSNRFTATETSDLGSIGVQARIYQDPNEITVRSKNAPLKNTVESVQKSVNDTEDELLNQLSENFSRPKQEIIDNFGQGLVFTAAEALERKMIQAIEPLQIAATVAPTTTGNEMSQETPNAGAAETKYTAEDVQLRESAAIEAYKAEQAQIAKDAETERLKAEAAATKRENAILNSEAGKLNPTKAAELVADADYTAELAVKTLAMLPPEGDEEQTDFHAGLGEQKDHGIAPSFSEKDLTKANPNLEAVIHNLSIDLGGDKEQAALLVAQAQKDFKEFGEPKQNRSDSNE